MLPAYTFIAESALRSSSVVSFFSSRSSVKKLFYFTLLSPKLFSFFRMAIVQYIEIDAQFDMIRCTDSFKHLVPFQRISKKTGLFNLTRAISPLKFK